MANCLQHKQFPEPEPWSAGGALLSRHRLRGTLFILLYGDQRCHCVLFSDNLLPVCFTSECRRTERTFTTARRCCGVFVILASYTKLTDLLTYLFTGSGYDRSALILYKARFIGISVCMAPLGNSYTFRHGQQNLRTSLLKLYGVCRRVVVESFLC